MTVLLLAWLVQANLVALDNDYVRVVRDASPCAVARTLDCADRVVVALGDLQLVTGSERRRMARGDVAVFGPDESYEPPSGAGYFEVNIKADHPSVLSPREIIAADKNALRFENERFFVFEEKLAPGDARPRHSHSQRVVIQLNRAKLKQWPDDGPPIFVETVPERPTFSPPVIHTVENVGDTPLRGIVIEFKPGSTTVSLQ